MAKERVMITMHRYQELQMLENRNKIQEAKIEELLEEIRMLKNNIPVIKTGDESKLYKFDDK